MTSKPISIEDLATQVRDLQSQINGLTALLAAMPEAQPIENEKARAVLDKLIDSSQDKHGGEQIARAMWIVQLVTGLRK